MNKEQILEEIKRTAKANGGVPLGRRRFESEIGISEYDWLKYWVRWNDAVSDAGFTPNRKSEAYPDDLLIEKLIEAAREVGHLPVSRELSIRARSDKNFPSESVFRRLGSKKELTSKVRKYCQEHKGYEDVLLLCGEGIDRDETEPNGQQTIGEKVGYVYLIKHGSRREYKIGKTGNPLRREGEIALQLPEKLEPLHYIQTDDPSGVESYWHARFSDKRKQGEWFALSPADIRTFKRWKRIY